MAVTEAQRLEMHLQLRKNLGDTVADTLVEHLPPTGWGDVARKGDLDQLESRMDLRFLRIDDQFSHVESRLRALNTGMWAVASIFSACFVALFTILATQL